MNKIERTYVIALTIIAATITVSQFISQKLILTNRLDSTIVNISGRQRMLSQKISKSSLKMIYTNDSIVFEQSKEELLNAISLWEKSNYALQNGDPELKIEFVNNSDTILTLFQELNLPFEKILQSAKALTGMDFQNRKQVQWLNYLEQILNYEDSFLTVMNHITFQYDKESRQKMKNLSSVEYILYIAAIILLLLEAFLIFRPAFKKLKLNTQKLIEREKELEKAKVEKQFLDELKEKNKELEQFAYITSHDLQEPLNTIISYTKLLKKSEDKIDKVGKRSIEIIASSSYRMKDFITSLLEYSRIGREKVRTSVNIKKMLEILKVDIHSLIEENEVTLKYIGEDLNVEAIEIEFIKLFQNLVINAIKYQKDGIRPIVIIDAKEQKGEYFFSISDNGIGIKEEYFEKIFEVFRRLHTRDKYEGTGIGLSYCKKIVELHKGKIWIESEEGVGTTFYFTISK